jgi:hypothetical protein
MSSRDISDRSIRASSPDTATNGDDVPSWMVGICGLAAVASALFTVLLFLNR